MNTYTKHLSEPWFSLIKIGAKTCEGRLNKGEFSIMKKGDKIIFI
jgi:ASC-1-like (ASCH) protein